MKILVVTPCTARKKHKPSNQLQPKDFNPPGWLNRRTRELERYETPAAQMYTGDGHKRLMNGVKNLQHTFGPDVVDLYIISPGYGLLNEDDPIVPYDYDFSKLSIVQIKQLGKKLKIHSKIECSLSRYDLAFFLLSEKYVIACLPCGLPFCVEKPVVQIFLVAERAQERIPPNPHIRVVHVEELVDRLEGANNYNVKEIVFERLCTVACNRGLEVFEEVKRNPQRMIDMVLDCNREL